MSGEVIGKRKRIVLLSVYFIGYLFLFQLLIQGFVYQKTGMNGFLIADALANAFMIVFFCFMLNDWLKQQWDIFNHSLKTNSKQIIITVLFLFAVAILFNLFVAQPLHLSEAENQVNNEALMQKNQIGFLLGSLIMAPFVEEVIFRGCIFHPCAHRYGFLIGALVSGLIFGGLHVMATVETGTWINLLYILDYGMCGFVLAGAYASTDSIWTAVIAHALFNLLGIISML